jgi:hypothetical protein
MNAERAIAESDKFMRRTMMRDGSGISGGAASIAAADYAEAPHMEAVA